jgi:hypothetical protein
VLHVCVYQLTRKLGVFYLVDASLLHIHTGVPTGTRYMQNLRPLQDRDMLRLVASTGSLDR